MKSLKSRAGSFGLPKSKPNSAKGNATAAEPKKPVEKDEVAILKERLAKGHRLTDAELAQLEVAAVARWNQLQREDDEEAERLRQAEAEKERKRDQQLQKELADLRKAAAADRANLERAGAAVADELRELRELRDAAIADRASLEASVSQELKELRAMRDSAERERQRKLQVHAQETALLGSIYDDDATGGAGGVDPSDFLGGAGMGGDVTARSWRRVAARRRARAPRRRRCR